MLFDEDSVWEDPATKTLERMFPSDFLSLAGFEQVSPTIEQLRNWAADPALVQSILGGSFTQKMGAVGDRNVASLAVLNGLRLVDFARAQQGRLWAQVHQIGLVLPEQLASIGPTANAVIGALVNVMSSEPDMLAEEVAKKAALSFYQIVSSFPIPSTTWQFAMAVVGVGKLALDIFASMRSGSVDRSRSRLPLRSVAGSEDMDAGRINAINAELNGPARDWTVLFQPSYTGRWSIVEIGEPPPREFGFGFVQSNPGDQGTPRGGASMGFMPGTNRVLGLMQQIMGWRTHRDEVDDSDTATWRSVWCNADDVPCGQTPENFRGDKNCRQCITINSIRSTSRGDWREFAGAGWVAGVNSRVTNVGDFLANSTQALAALWNSFTPTNPASCCVDAEGLFVLWHDTFARFFEEDAERLWREHDSYAWRALCSRFFASMMISREDGNVGGVGTLVDWRVGWGDYGKDGIWIGDPPPLAPLHASMSKNDAAAILGIVKTPFGIDDSIWAKAISPAISHLGGVQKRLYESSAVAYLWERQGAHWNPAAGKLRNNWAGKAYEAGLRALLDTPSLLGAVDMRHVVDPEIKKLFVAAGAKPWQIGGQILAPNLPELGGKANPPRANYSGSRPADPITPLSGEWTVLEAPPPPRGGYPGNPIAPVGAVPDLDAIQVARLERDEGRSVTDAVVDGAASAVGAILGTAAVGGAVWVAQRLWRGRR